MDPKETLRLIDQYISDGRYTDARFLLADYWRWRAHGGFEPTEPAGTRDRGDVFARKCRERLQTAAIPSQRVYTVTIDEPPMSFGEERDSLDEALAWAKTQAQRIEQTYDSDEDFGQIYCEDDLGNSWSLVEDNGIYSWEPDVRIDFSLDSIAAQEIHHG